MKKALLRAAGKTILNAGLFFWNMRTSWAFKLHQKLVTFATNLDRKHNLDLRNEANSGKDPNRF